MSEAAAALETPAPAPTPSPAPAPAPTPSPAAAPSERWQDKFLSEELRGNEFVGRYGSVEDLAKGHIETATWARGRIPVPVMGDPANPESKAKFDKDFGEFAAKVRPAEAKDYKLGDAEGKPTETSEAFRPLFHEIGLHAHQAEQLNAGFNQWLGDQESKQRQAGKDELTAIELELGPQAYEQRKQAAFNMFEAAGVEFDDAAALLAAIEQSKGAGAAMRAAFKLAESTGELAKVDGVSVSLAMGTMSAASAQAELDRQNENTDPAFIKALEDPNSKESKRRMALMERVAQGDKAG